MCAFLHRCREQPNPPAEMLPEESPAQVDTPNTQVSTKARYAALARAGISDFRWHDLRHAWTSWHVRSGTPLFALQELGGRGSAEMVRRYAHLAADHLAPYADRLSALRVVAPDGDVTNMAQA